MPTVNWTTAIESAAGELEADVPPSPGTYLAEVEHAEWAETKNGKPMFKYRLRITAGPEKYKAIFGQIVVSQENPRAMAICLRDLAALGLSADFLKTSTDTEQEERVVGENVKVTIENREWKGQTRADVKGIVPDTSTPSKASDVPPPTSPPPAAAGDDGPPPSPFSE